ncbi:sulfatase-like hydrolase/transferase [Flavobacterium pedocola]
MLPKKTIFLLLLFTTTVFSQQKIENMIIVTIDGLRWQEVFYGMDARIASKKKYNPSKSKAAFNDYRGHNYKQRRKKLMPFLWTVVEEQGQLYGNRKHGSKVNNANPYLFSYPGYSEIFCGYVDKNIDSNGYPENPNTNILEFLNLHPSYNGKVAAFTAWETFNRILNEQRSGFPVFAAFDSIGGKNPNEKEKLLNNMLQNSLKPWNDRECLDVFTHYAAMEYLTARNPKIVYIAYGETDEWAHVGKYQNYLNAANQIDKWLEEIWNYVQSSPHYKNKTALLITVDHGRGSKRKSHWTKHGESIPGSDQVWFAIMGPGIPAKGEVKKKVQLYQNQIAQTIAGLLDMKFIAAHPVEESFCTEIFSK